MTGDRSFTSTLTKPPTQIFLLDGRNSIPTVLLQITTTRASCSSLAAASYKTNEFSPDCEIWELVDFGWRAVRISTGPLFQQLRADPLINGVLDFLPSALRRRTPSQWITHLRQSFSTRPFQGTCFASWLPPRIREVPDVLTRAESDVHFWTSALLPILQRLGSCGERFLKMVVAACTLRGNNQLGLALPVEASPLRA